MDAILQGWGYLGWVFTLLTILLNHNNLLIKSNIIINQNTLLIIDMMRFFQAVSTNVYGCTTVPAWRLFLKDLFFLILEARTLLLCSLYTMYYYLLPPHHERTESLARRPTDALEAVIQRASFSLIGIIYGIPMSHEWY